MRQRKIVGLGVAAILAVGAAYLLAKPSSPQHLQLLPPADARTWPQNRAWTWSFPMPALDEGTALGLEVREKSKSIGKTSPTMSASDIPMTHAEADHTFGTSWLGGVVPAPPTGTVSLNLLDLHEIGVQSDKPEKTLRILGSISIGGASTSLTGDSIYLDGNSIAGWSIGESHWNHDELLVLQFVTGSEGQQNNYDVVLVKKRMR